LNVNNAPAVSRGFTLTEVIAILVLLGITSVVAISRFNPAPFQTASFDQELRSAVRFAQKFAIVSGCDVQVDIDAAGDRYALRLRNDVASASDCLSAGDAFGTPLNHPTGGAAAGTAPGNVDITAGLTFFYDRRGRPSPGGGTIDVDGRTITVEPGTGYVY
jgi:MSHA pilin protein MshC